MKYGSLFSGIGGFDLGLDRAGMTCAWQVEKDEKACNVLKKHWPDVPKYKDVKNVGKQNLEPVDLICGGFPCQDVSIAGHREGLAGKRSGLWFEFHRIIEELKPQWIIIENVTGLLSSNRGRDMGAIVGGLAELGYWWAYRVLDAQFWGVPQRRRRVFIVASLTRGRPQEVLFERESSPWDTPPCRETREEVAGTIAAGAHPDSYNGQDAYTGNLIASPVTCRSYADNEAQHGKLIAFAPQAGGKTGLNINEDMTGTLQENQVMAVAHSVRPRIRDAARIAFGGNNTQGEVSVATRCNAHGSGRYDFESETFICNTFNGYTGGPDDNDAQANHIIAFDKPVDTLCNKGTNHTGGLSNASTQETNPGEILSFLRQKIGEKAFAKWGLGILDTLQQAEILQSTMHGKSIRRKSQNKQSEMDDSSLSCAKENQAGTVRKMWVSKCFRRTSQEWELEGQYANELRTYLSQLSQQGTQKEKALFSLWQASEGIGILRQALSEIQKMGKSISSETQPTQSTIGVRRLTPLEVERLQGFPDNWTAGQSDSARYRQLGNAVAVPVAEWLGKRILSLI